MAEVEVFIAVTVKNDDGTEQRHALSGVHRQAKEITQTVAVVGMKTLKQILAEMKGES